MKIISFFFLFLCCACTSQARYRDEIHVFLILNMHVGNKKSGISFLYLTEIK